MAGSVNKAILVGHLGKDPERRSLGSGDPVVSFSVATSESWKDKATGERKERTDWHNVVIFNTGLCDVADRYLRKGSKVYLEGKIQTRKWQDQGGVDRWTTEVVLARFGGELVLLDKAERAAPDPDGYGTTSSRDTGQGYGAAKSGERAPAQTGRPSYASDLDDDIPF